MADPATIDALVSLYHDSTLAKTQTTIADAVGKITINLGINESVFYAGDIFGYTGSGTGGKDSNLLMEEVASHEGRKQLSEAAQYEGQPPKAAWDAAADKVARSTLSRAKADGVITAAASVGRISEAPCATPATPHQDSQPTVTTVPPHRPARPAPRTNWPDNAQPQRTVETTRTATRPGAPQAHA